MSNILYLERVEWELVTRSKSLYFSRDFPPGLHVFVHVPFLLLSLSISIHLIVALARDRNKQFTHPQKDTAASLPLFSGPLVLAHRYLYQISEQVCLYLTLPFTLPFDDLQYFLQLRSMLFCDDFFTFVEGVDSCNTHRHWSPLLEGFHSKGTCDTFSRPDGLWIGWPKGRVFSVPLYS